MNAADTVQQFPPVSQVRQPRGLVRVAGELLPWVEWEVDNNTFYQADTFRVVFSALEMPAAYNLAWWTAQTEIVLEVFAGFPTDPTRFQPSDLQRLIYGRVDHLEYDPVTNTLVASGRDLTSYFIDTKTTEEWKNLTSSQIATQLAQRHDLTPVVTATSTKVGSYYQIDHVLVTNQHSEWDLLSYLAANEKFVVYVTGHELHFEPRPDPTKATPYILQWTPPTTDDPIAKFNGMHLHFQHDLTIAKGVVVWVRAVNVKTGKVFSVSYPANKAKGTKPGQASPNAQVHPRRMKGPQTPEAALAYAQSEHRAITQHEVKITALLPGDNALSVTNVIQVRGTGSAFDQTYYTDAITRHMSMQGGYTMHVSAKNSVPNNQGAL